MSNSDRVINWSKSIELAQGKKAAARELLAMFIKILPKYRENLKKSLQDKNYEELLTQVHNLNGSACYVSVPVLKKLIYNLETAIKKKETAKYADFIEQIELQMNRVIYVYENEIYKR